MPLDLTWNAPSACPDESAVRASLLRLVAENEAPSRYLKADISVEKSAAGGWTLTLRTELDGILGERILRGRACSTVADAAVLTLALMLNPDARLSSDATTKSSPPEGPSDTRTHPTAAARVPPHAPARSLRLLGTSQLGLQWGVLRQAGPELGLGLGAARGPVSLWLRLGYDPPQNSFPARSAGNWWKAVGRICGCARMLGYSSAFAQHWALFGHGDQSS